MTPDEIGRRIDRLETDIHEMAGDVSELRKHSIEADTRFSNGREVMAEIKKDLSDLKPKTPDWLKLVAAAATVFVAGLGAHEWLIQQLNDRPNQGQIEKLFRQHAEEGHPQLQRDLEKLREEIYRQGVLIQTLADQVATVGAGRGHTATRH